MSRQFIPFPQILRLFPLIIISQFQLSRVDKKKALCLHILLKERTINYSHTSCVYRQGIFRVTCSNLSAHVVIRGIMGQKNVENKCSQPIYYQVKEEGTPNSSYTSLCSRVGLFVCSYLNVHAVIRIKIEQKNVDNKWSLQKYK